LIAESPEDLAGLDIHGRGRYVPARAVNLLLGWGPEGDAQAAAAWEAIGRADRPVTVTDSPQRRGRRLRIASLRPEPSAGSG